MREQSRTTGRKSEGERMEKSAETRREYYFDSLSCTASEAAKTDQGARANQRPEGPCDHKLLSRWAVTFRLAVGRVPNPAERKPRGEVGSAHSLFEEGEGLDEAEGSGGGFHLHVLYDASISRAFINPPACPDARRGCSRATQHLFTVSILLLIEYAHHHWPRHVQKLESLISKNFFTNINGNIRTAMRLLDLNLSLIEFVGDIPPYAILSHTWGADHEEVTYKDVVTGLGNTKAGYKKLHFCREQASRDGLSYFWVDTCCIDKSSSSELTEAINSMFRWYRYAAKCYVYLVDVLVGGIDENVEVTRESTFRNKLVAPRLVEFFSLEGKRLGDKSSLETQIQDITGIPTNALRGTDLSQFSVAERISWAATRETKREEDRAYSLLGLFEVYMPLIYGEGRDNAFNRLRAKIDKRLRNYEPEKKASSEASEFSINQAKLVVYDTTRNTNSSISTLTSSKTIFEASSESLASGLQPASVEEDLRELLNQRHFATCRWIFDTLEFSNWQPHLRPILWIRGKPGSGKSILSATLIEHLQAEGTVTAYFFCSLGDDSRRTFESFLQTWLWQILEQMPEFTQCALQHQKKGPGIRGQHEPVKNALGDIISRSTKIICLIVDGLDECEPASADKLIHFVSTMGQNCLFAIISRPENWIRKALDSGVKDRVCIIPVTNSATEKDLGRWIQACVGQEWALAKLQEGADGMFLWARFQLEALEAQFAIEDAKAVLQNDLPKDLEATYERLLAKIQDIPNALRRARAFRIQQWITAANRPLTLNELDFALGIHIDSQVSPQQRSLMRGESDVVEACGSFVEITKAGQIRFVYASAKDFLTSKGVQFGLSQPYPVDRFQKALSAMHIARACITSLSFSDISLIGKRPSRLSDVEKLHAFIVEYPFLEYAALNWWKHLDKIPYEDGGLLQSTIAQFLGSSEKTWRWLQLYQYLTQFHSMDSVFSHPNTT
ncbi:HET-domain-containing protein [Mytilinidion resinicola]|uniref:HET-domain-containing protein n=1 Tax=Mytilinidion resinicola TaxID=574789 RepID=A0A6A6YGE4_9PEZI|nr:HET-domain-containing protein [Mytilinidion resinicola]KAF2807886.1 HET-domain-containing protein [Mytilinidion resinicola]